MTKKEIRVEALSEILSDESIVATKEQIEKIEDQFSAHIEMEGEMDFNQHRGFYEECHKCASLRAKIAELEQEIEIYKSSVKSRRNASSVWTENGDVFYS